MELRCNYGNSLLKCTTFRTALPNPPHPIPRHHHMLDQRQLQLGRQAAEAVGDLNVGSARILISEIGSSPAA